VGTNPGADGLCRLVCWSMHDGAGVCSPRFQEGCGLHAQEDGDAGGDTKDVVPRHERAGVLGLTAATGPSNDTWSSVGFFPLG